VLTHEGAGGIGLFCRDEHNSTQSLDWAAGNVCLDIFYRVIVASIFLMTSSDVEELVVTSCSSRPFRWIYFWNDDARFGK
jgi:hypothetical protein